MSETSYDFTGLDPHTTYYFQLTLRDAAGNASAPSAAISTATLAEPVTGISIQNVYLTSATLNWTAHPPTPSSSSAKGYILDASSTNFDGSGEILIAIISSGTGRRPAASKSTVKEP